MVIEDSNKMVKGLQDIIKSKKSNKQEKEKTSALIDSGKAMKSSQLFQYSSFG